MKKRFKLLPVAIAALIIIVALLLVMRAQGSSAQQKALDEAIEKTLAASSLHATADFHINLPQKIYTKERPFHEVEFSVEGDLVADESGTRFTGTLDGEATGRGNTFFTGGDLRISPQKSLFYLDNIPALLNPSGSLLDRWTRVNASPLAFSDTRPLKQVVASLSSAAYESSSKDGADTVYQYRLEISDEEEEQLAHALHREQTGNALTHIISRLLTANDLEAITLGVNSKTQAFEYITARFMRPIEDGETFDFVTVTIGISDYNKDVTVDEPQTEQFVQPEVFTKLIGA